MTLVAIRYWLALLAASLPGLAMAETRIQDFYGEVQGHLARLHADPFEPDALRQRQQALLASYVGRELRIPNPPVGMSRRGSAQGLWPLEFIDGRLRLTFDSSGGYAPMMADAPWNWWSRDYSGPARGQKTKDGRDCRLYTERSGYGWVLVAPATIKAYIDDGFRQSDSDLQERITNDEFSVDFALDLARARSLSGKLATYVRLSSLTAIERVSEAHNGLRNSSTGHCYGGEQYLLTGRIDRLRIHRLGSDEDLVRLRFDY